jgi:hypothetical protein
MDPDVHPSVTKSSLANSKLKMCEGKCGRQALARAVGPGQKFEAESSFLACGQFLLCNHMPLIINNDDMSGT